MNSNLWLSLSVIIYAYKISIRRTQETHIKRVAPEPSGALPFIGHLHRLQGQAPLARILGNMADDYGPAYSLRLGSNRALVVSSWQMIKECFTTNERNFATRPNMAASRYMIHDKAGFAMSPHGPYWRDIRKLVVSKLFTAKRVKMFKNVRNSEVKNSINELSLLHQKNGDRASVMNMNKWFEHITFNINIRVLAGKRILNQSIKEEDSHVKEAIKELLYLIGVFVVSDFFPNLEWMDIGGHVKAMKQVAKEIDGVIGKWLNEHIEKTKECDDHDDDEEGDFLDVMLATLPKDAEMFGHGRETIIKATISVGAHVDWFRKHCYDNDMGTLFVTEPSPHPKSRPERA
ncbi:hypothetical protein L1987_50666 [Smallanthus sonchifolius]|uniref:Uncharacterized protein n=1 Tax=Smallanthus sonchifolius TaxID=185202 RepID=A0ACB9ENS4_9ASTR|nr:hypothetical protein L1987_50666 [Smallanthus sonchifolius]